MAVISPSDRTRWDLPSVERLDKTPLAKLFRDYGLLFVEPSGRRGLHGGAHHPWRLPKRVTYLFDWLATQIGLFLHPKPIILPNGYFDTG